MIEIHMNTPNFTRAYRFDSKQWKFTRAFINVSETVYLNLLITAQRSVEISVI
jgi:hypothetical protein